MRQLSRNIIKFPYISFLFRFFCKFCLFIYPFSLVFPNASLYSVVNFLILCLFTNLLLSRFAPIYILFCQLSSFCLFPYLPRYPSLLLVFSKTLCFLALSIYAFLLPSSFLQYLYLHSGWTVLRIYFSVAIQILPLQLAFEVFVHHIPFFLFQSSF